MGVTLSEVKRAARAHRAPLAGESAGYLVLAIADQVLQAPRLVQADEVQLTEDGALRVMAGRASSEEDAELSLRSALDQLLLVSTSGSAALTRASRRTAPVGLSGLVRELEAALIPVNRSAARRALSRLHRETARALESGHLPPEEPPKAAESVEPPVAPQPAVVAPMVAAPAPAPVLAPSEAVASEGPEREDDQELETPTRAVSAAPLPAAGHSQLDGVLSALCDELPAPPQFVESDALTAGLAVRTAPPAVVEPVAAPEPQFVFDIDVEFESDEFATEAVDSSAAPTVMRALAVEPAAPPPSADEAREAASEEAMEEAMEEASGEPPAFDAPLEARTVPEPVMLRKTLRPLLDLLPKPSRADSDPLPQTPTLGNLATHLPILAPEQIAKLSAESSAAASRGEEPREELTERAPEVLPLAPGVALVESKKSDVNELLSSFQVAEPQTGPALCRAIKEMAELDLTPAPFAALIR